MTSPVEYIELNLSNYGPDDVAQLNEWGIWASGEIERLQRENATFHALADAVEKRLNLPMYPETHQEQVNALAEDMAISCLMGELRAELVITPPGPLLWVTKSRSDELKAAAERLKFLESIFPPASIDAAIEMHRKAVGP